MKKIILTKGKFTIVDDKDYEWLNRINWYYSLTKDGNEYVLTKINYKTTYMHRLILNLQNSPKHIYTDHINGNGLDNRRQNLRISNNHLNQANQKLSKSSTSGFKGVYWHKQNNRWAVQIMVERKHISLGGYKDKLEAAKAYDQGALKYFGEYARLNFAT